MKTPLTQNEVSEVMSYFGSLSKGKPKAMTTAAIAQRKQAGRLSADKRKRAAAARREAVRKRA